MHNCVSAKTSTLAVFESKRCDDFSVDIKFISADQNILWLRIFWQLHFGLVLLKLLEHLIKFMCFFLLVFVFKKIATNFTYVEQCAKLVKNKSEHFFYFFFYLMRSASHPSATLRRVLQVYIYIYIYIYINYLETQTW